MHLPFDDSTVCALTGAAPATVRDWRNGRRRPSEAAARLLALYSTGQVIPQDAPGWRGFRFTRDGRQLVCDNGLQLHPGQLSQLRLVLDMLDSLHATVADLRAEIAAQDAYIAELEGGAAAANDARPVPLTRRQAREAVRSSAAP